MTKENACVFIWHVRFGRKKMTEGKYPLVTDNAKVTLNSENAR